jgi:hypothetical protein
MGIIIGVFNSKFGSVTQNALEYGYVPLGLTGIFTQNYLFILSLRDPFERIAVR